VIYGGFLNSGCVTLEPRDSHRDRGAYLGGFEQTLFWPLPHDELSEYNETLSGEAPCWSGCGSPDGLVCFEVAAGLAGADVLGRCYPVCDQQGDSGEARSGGRPVDRL
jgi:hypothetical protein